MKKEHHCFWCGDSLGFYDSFGEEDSCGKRECQKELRYAHESDRADRMARAERDNYEKYRGF